MMQEDTEVGALEHPYARPRVFVAESCAHEALCRALIAAGVEVLKAEEIGSDEPLARLQTLAAAYREPEQGLAHHAAWRCLERRGKKGKPRRW